MDSKGLRDRIRVLDESLALHLGIARDDKRHSHSCSIIHICSGARVGGLEDLRKLEEE